MTWQYPAGIGRFSYRMQMSYLWFSAHILNLSCITLSEWRSNEIIKCLPITKPGFASSKLQGGFIVRSIKRVPLIPKGLVVNRIWAVVQKMLEKLIVRAFLNLLLHAVSVRNPLLEGLNALFSTNIFKKAHCLGVV